jgi:hypothetical protein
MAIILWYDLNDGVHVSYSRLGVLRSAALNPPPMLRVTPFLPPCVALLSMITVTFLLTMCVIFLGMMGVTILLLLM